MKNLKGLYFVSMVLLFSFIIIFSKCKVNCSAADIVFNPSADTASREPNEAIAFDIVVTDISWLRNNYSISDD